jgi:arylsulfatase A
VGHLPEYLPLNNGFDYYFGIPYSNDMVPPRYKRAPELPLYENEKVIENGPDQRLLTKRYTEKAINFIKENRKKPFFLYYANHFPHTPLHASDDFIGKSKRGLYGDVVEELDWSVGQILQTLKEQKLDKNTLVIFTSDNGPWLRQKEHGGSAGLLFEGKGSTYEGGFRVPAVAWWPGTIKPNQTSTAIATTMDLYPTILNLANVPLPQDRILDGKDVFPVLSGQQEEVQDVVYYYYRDKIYAIRKGPWKAHFITKPSYTKVEPEVHNPPLLNNLNIDPSEKYDVSDEHPEVIEEILQLYEEHKKTIDPAFSQLDLNYRK